VGILREKGQKNFLEGFAREKYKYFKPQPEMQQQKRFLLHFYVTIFGHFKGKSPKNFFRRLCKGKFQVFQAPTGYYLVVLTTLDEPARNGKVHTPRTGQDGVRLPNNVPDTSGLTHIR